MHYDKDYNKLMKELEKDTRFNITNNSRKSTVKVIHIKSGNLYSVHPGKNVILPLKKWIDKFEKE